VRIRRRRPLACQQVVELVTDYLEGVLSRSDQRRFEAHLDDCPHCSEYLHQMRTVITATGHLTPDDLSPQMQDEFIALFRRWKIESD
jgi:anti-sigma factor RsiW